MEDDEFDNLIANNKEINYILNNTLTNSNEENDLEIKVEVPHAFPFPFKPYDIQLGFMQKLYETIELGKIGIFESPTGTGKSLSLICGSLLWLRHYEEKKLHELNKLLLNKGTEQLTNIPPVKTEAGDDWIVEFAKKQEQEAKAQALLEEKELRKKREEKLKVIKSSVKQAKRKRDSLDEQFKELFNSSKDLNTTTCGPSEDAAGGEDDEVLLTEYVSDDDGDETNKIAEDSDDGGSGGNDDDLMKEDHVVKIYYCSRTHSQLTQFIHEVQNSPYADDIRVTSLGSRLNLCINNAVKRLNSVSLINEKCTDMQKCGKPKVSEPSVKKSRQPTGVCPFYKYENVTEFRDRILVEVKDIEDLVTMGKQMKACPYYATRRAIPSAQLVVLPYNTLLHKATRESSGIKLDGNIVIIDEGHNLVDAISQMYSIEVTGLQLCSTHSHLLQYLDRYKNRLKAKNVLYINQLIFIINSCIKALGGKPPDLNQSSTRMTAMNGPETSKIMTINDFLFECRLDNLNLFKIRRYCQKSLIAKKLHGFTQTRHSLALNEHQSNHDKATSPWALSNFISEVQQQNALKQARLIEENLEEDSPVMNMECNYRAFPPCLSHIENFLEALTNADKDGRVLICKKAYTNRSTIKFLMLNPAVHFKEIVDKCQAVIIAGGTMQPVSDFKEQLLLSIGIKPSKIVEYSCDHIISHDQLAVISLAHGPSGHLLDFTFKNKETLETMKELGRVLYNTCYVVPAGVVCFFPSFDYMAKVLTCWEKTGFVEKIEARKKIFKEPKKASDVDKVLEDYSNCIQKHQSRASTSQPLPSLSSNEPTEQNGAIIFCVVGGKMSEGINFSDDMGRCIVMVGMPYPNLTSVELKEKMDYLNANLPPSTGGKLPGRAYYESLCMKAINQSIGRAIRHRADYACILLLDHRFMGRHILSKLPTWIQGHLQVYKRFGPTLASLKKFFANKKPGQIQANQEGNN